MMMIDDQEPRSRTAESGGAISPMSELDAEVWAVVDFNGVIHDAPLSYAAANALMTSCDGHHGATIVTAAVAHRILLSQQKKRGQNNDNDS